MRVIVCGGRHYHKKDELFAALDKIDAETPISTVISGGAVGADQLAHMWAVERKKESIVMHAEWKKYKQQAGHIRNRHMLQYGKPDKVIAFLGGAGTENMIKQAYSRKLPVIFAGSWNVTGLVSI